MAVYPGVSLFPSTNLFPAGTTTAKATSSTSRLSVTSTVIPVAPSAQLSRVEVKAISSSSMTSRFALNSTPNASTAMLSRVEVLSAVSKATSSTSRLSVNALAVNASSLTSRLSLGVTATAVTGQLSRIEVSIQPDASSYTSRLALISAPLSSVIQPISQPAASRSVVILDGSASTGSPSAFTWVQISGPSVTLGNPNSQRTIFTVPPTVSGDNLVFRLTVSVSGASNSSTVIVPILPQVSWYASGGNWLPVQLKTITP